VDFTREGDRFRARDDVADVLRPRIAARSSVDVGAAFERCGVCWSRYQSVEDLVRLDPDCSEGNPLFRSIHQPGVGTLLAPTTPLDFAAGGRLPPAAAPRLGQHTAEVLTEVLGLTAAGIDQLDAKSVIVCAAPAGTRASR